MQQVQNKVDGNGNEVKDERKEQQGSFYAVLFAFTGLQQLDTRLRELIFASLMLHMIRWEAVQLGEAKADGSPTTLQLWRCRPHCCL